MGTAAPGVKNPWKFSTLRVKPINQDPSVARKGLDHEAGAKILATAGLPLGAHIGLDTTRLDAPIADLREQVPRHVRISYSKDHKEVQPMGGQAVVQYQVAFTRDPETASVVAEIPALQIADVGVDVPEALDRLQSMVTFHLDCLIQEG